MKSVQGEIQKHLLQSMAVCRYASFINCVANLEGQFTFAGQRTKKFSSVA